MEGLKFGQPPMRGSFSLVYIVVVGGLLLGVSIRQALLNLRGQRDIVV